MDLGEAIKKRRKELRITQADLAKRLDVHPTTVSDWERGALPRPQHFDGLALFLGLPRSDVAAIAVGENPSSDDEPDPVVLSLFRTFRDLKPADQALIRSMMDRMREQ